MTPICLVLRAHAPRPLRRVQLLRRRPAPRLLRRRGRAAPPRAARRGEPASRRRHARAPARRRAPFRLRGRALGLSARSSRAELPREARGFPPPRVDGARRAPLGHLAPAPPLAALRRRAREGSPRTSGAHAPGARTRAAGLRRRGALADRGARSGARGGGVRRGGPRRVARLPLRRGAAPALPRRLAAGPRGRRPILVGPLRALLRPALPGVADLRGEVRRLDFGDTR